MGTYKYQAEIDALIQQGLRMPEVVNPNDLKGFRFVFKNNLDNSYLPNYIMKPQRAIINVQRKVDVGGYALSCFTQKEKAVKFYHSLARKYEKYIQSNRGRNLFGNRDEHRWQHYQSYRQRALQPL